MILSSVVERVLPDAGEAPLPLVRDKVLQAARDFCDNGNAWVIKGVKIRIWQNVTGYRIPLPDHSELVRVLHQGAGNFVNISPQEVTSDGIIFSALPPRDGEINLDIVVRPISLDAQIDALDSRAIECGTLFYLKRMNGSSWANMGLAEYYRRELESETTKAKQTSWCGNQGGSIKVKSRRFI